MATVYERRSEIAREQGYASLYDRTSSRAAAKVYLEEHGETYTANKADEMARFAREHEAGTLSRQDLRDWWQDNVDDGNNDDDAFYDWLREWTDSGETV